MESQKKAVIRRPCFPSSATGVVAALYTLEQTVGQGSGVVTVDAEATPMATGAGAPKITNNYYKINVIEPHHLSVLCAQKRLKRDGHLTLDVLGMMITHVGMMINVAVIGNSSRYKLLSGSVSCNLCTYILEEHVFMYPVHIRGSIIVTCFSPEADSLLPKCTKLLSYTPDPDPYVPPSIIKALENTKHVFKLHFGVGSSRGYPKFILDSAADALPPMLRDIPKDTDEGASSSAAQPAVEENVVTKMPVGSITPPPNTDEPVEKNKPKTETVSTTVRKELFVGADEEPTGPND